MAWRDLKSFKDIPLGLSLGTVSKILTGQNLSIRPKQYKKLSPEMLDKFSKAQEEEREKLFMVFANHFTASEDIEAAREDFWGFINYLYGTYTLRSHVDKILVYPEVVEALIDMYINQESELKKLTYELDSNSQHVSQFGEALDTSPIDLTETISAFNGRIDDFITALTDIIENYEVEAAQGTSDERNNNQDNTDAVNEDNTAIKEAV